MDTTGLGPAVRVQPMQVTVRVEVEPLHERTLTAVPIRLPSRATAGWAATLDTVTVRLRGRAARLATLDADSIVVTGRVVGAHAAGQGRPASDHAGGRDRTSPAGQRRDRAAEGRWLSGSWESRPPATRPPPRCSAPDGGRPALAGLVILSQDVHRIFGGVVPELASRAHVQAIGSVVDRALADAGIGAAQLDGIAVTAGPGLVGALLVGVMYGKTLAFSLDRPLIGVNHLEGHIFAPTLEDPELAPPFVALLVSGGHTMLLDVPAWGDYRLLGQTLDDAAGEAFDKVAKLLGLGYPGGAADRAAGPARDTRTVSGFPARCCATSSEADPSATPSPSAGSRPRCSAPSAQAPISTRDRADLARGFQDAALDVLTAKTAHAVEALGYSTAMIGGGVACNRTLAERLRASGWRGGPG